MCKMHTISKRTSPAANDSPSFFFQDVIPPSVIVGDIAGIVKLCTAFLSAVVCNTKSLGNVERSAEPFKTGPKRYYSQYLIFFAFPDPL